MAKTNRIAVLVFALGAAACGGADVPADAETEAAATPASEAAGSQLDDEDIAAIVVTANSIDISNGELAAERAVDEQVKAFAATMVTDHSAVNQSARELVTRLGVTPTENDVSRSLQASAEQTQASLAALSGAEFDRAYIAHEVEYHRTVLSALDDTLIPQASNPELRQTLVDVRPAFAAHLQHAETILQQLGRN